MKCVAILETMYDWRGMTSGAGYREAPHFFRINPENYSGRRLYKLIGPDAQLLVTNACRELVSGPNHHGKPDPQWLAENLAEIEVRRPDSATIDVLLVCGKVAQKNNNHSTYYGDLFTVTYPQHGNFFSKRRRVSEAKPACEPDIQVHDLPREPNAAGDYRMTEIAHLNAPNFHRP